MSYYRLANYLRPMEQDKTTHIFKPNIHSDSAVNLYFFDKKLRALLFTAIQSFEIALRSKLIHHFSMAYGSFWIMTGVCLPITKSLTIALFVLNRKFSTQKRIPFRNILTNTPIRLFLLYGKLWTWFLKIFCNLKDTKLKKKIAREFNLPQHEYLESWCKCAVALCNCLAHHSRTWNRRYPMKPQLPCKLKGEWIDISITLRTKLYAQLCCLAYWQNTTHPSNDFKQQLKSLLKVHPNVEAEAMGFPVG